MDFGIVFTDSIVSSRLCACTLGGSLNPDYVIDDLFLFDIETIDYL